MHEKKPKLFHVLFLLSIHFRASWSESSTSLLTSISVNLDGRDVHLNASHFDDLHKVAETFCEEHRIEHRRCAHFIAVELSDALWCKSGQKDRARELGISNVPRV